MQAEERFYGAAFRDLPLPCVDCQIKLSGLLRGAHTCWSSGEQRASEQRACNMYLLQSKFRAWSAPAIWSQNMGSSKGKNAPYLRHLSRGVPLSSKIIFLTWNRLSDVINAIGVCRWGSHISLWVSPESWNEKAEIKIKNKNFHINTGTANLTQIFGTTTKNVFLIDVNTF